MCCSLWYEYTLSLIHIYETKFSNLVDEVKQQKDQSIVVWYYDYEPAVDNAPANTWNTDAVSYTHLDEGYEPTSR